MSRFLDSLQESLSKSYSEIAKNYFLGATTGESKYFEKSSKAQLEYDKTLTKEGVLNQLELAKTNVDLSNELRRTAEVLFLEAKSKNTSPQLLEKSIEIQQKIEEQFTKFRAEVNGKKLTDNKLEEILSTTRDRIIAKNHWQGSKEIGSLVKENLLDLVHTRNQIAKEAGYENYHKMMLELSEIEPENLDKIFDDLYHSTEEAYSEYKKDIDIHLCKKFSSDISELMPWHYGNRFFQEGPAIYSQDIDSVYNDKDIHSITKNFYDSIGLNIDPISENSDLHEREGKNQHAFCIDIDRDKRDIRVLCNIVPSHRWMDTDLHEFGHAAYDYYIDQNLPWAVKIHAHILVTEAIAMLFGRLAGNAAWINENVSSVDTTAFEEPLREQTALSQLVFSRWAQVMYNFEKELYANPNQDLQKLWWELVNKYQKINIPTERLDSVKVADWATKIHIATVPCYYHNYQLGELLASQLIHHISDNISSQHIPFGSWKGHTEIGKYLKEEIFEKGRLLRWDDLIVNATGKPITSESYTKDFCDKLKS
ncbi:MAG: hypothetical protein Kapaf2KO_12370 [Candidatus Kapaibacteriales bacterium]